MSGVFISGVKTPFANSSLTVDWFHVVQMFTKAIEEVRRAESEKVSMPKACRWATLKNAKGQFTEAQLDALEELVPWISTPPMPGESKNCSFGAQGHFHENGAMAVDLVS